MSDRPRCDGCRYFQVAYQDSDYGECRRHAPRPIPDAVMVPQWPAVKVNDWCGEYKYINPGPAKVTPL